MDNFINWLTQIKFCFNFDRNQRETLNKESINDNIIITINYIPQPNVFQIYPIKKEQSKNKKYVNSLYNIQQIRSYQKQLNQLLIENQSIFFMI